MFGGFSLAQQPAQPYKPPCIVVPNPHDFAPCKRPSGEHTALGFPICDECHAAISEEGLDAGPKPQVLGGFGES